MLRLTIPKVEVEIDGEVYALNMALNLAQISKVQTTLNALQEVEVENLTPETAAKHDKDLDEVVSIMIPSLPVEIKGAMSFHHLTELFQYWMAEVEEQKKKGPLAPDERPSE